MKTYVEEIAPRISQKQWVAVNDITNVKTIFIFKSNNELLIYENGIGIGTNSWRYLDSQSLEIKKNQVSYFMKQTFLDENILILKRGGTDESDFFINETIYGHKLKTHKEIIDYLHHRYKIGGTPPIFGPHEKLAVAIAIFVIVFILAMTLLKKLI